MSMKYDVNYFINKFEAIPEDDWGAGDLQKHCALYHCGLVDNVYKHNDETIALAKLFGAKEPMYGQYGTPLYMDHIYLVNDGIDEYKSLGNTPKERILNKLYQIRDGNNLA